MRRCGEVVFAGKRLPGGPGETVARAGIAHVPEGRGIFAELTVWENLRMGAYMRRGRPDFRMVLDYFPWLDARRNQQAGTLSGGEQQMLALARAFLQRPRLLMLDEPSLGLAPLVTREVFRVVGDLNQKEGLAVLVVEQNAAIALSTASRAYVLETGNGIGSSDPCIRRRSARRPEALHDGRTRSAGRCVHARALRPAGLSIPKPLHMQQFFQALTSGLADGSIYGRSRSRSC